MAKPQVENDWKNDDEDDWDDWGDAEDNEIEQCEVAAAATTSDTNVKIQAQKPTSKEVAKDADLLCKQKSIDSGSSSNVQSPREERSWASMLKPFGGVVSTITTSVSQGINQVIGVPDPEELARMNAAEAAAKAKEAAQNNSEEAAQVENTTTPSFGMDLVSGVTTLGSRVLNTGLDTLEGIGKKTMNMLQENDPLLMNKRKLLGLEAEKPNLSALLQEAKKDADQLEQTLQQLQIEKKKTALRFESLFENNCGLMHLEALEILSKESNMKLQKLLEAISGQALLDLRETINEVKELMQLEDLETESDGNFSDSELNEQLNAAIEDADLKINFVEIVKLWTDCQAWLETEHNVEEIFSKVITMQAEICALQINKLHKIAEILLVKEHHSTASEVDAIVQLCKQFNMLLNGLTNRFASVLPADDEGKKITNEIFSEMLTATQQIEKAFKLFLPILQIGAV